jgi:hypothetical protein
VYELLQDNTKKTSEGNENCGWRIRIDNISSCIESLNNLKGVPEKLIDRLQDVVYHLNLLVVQIYGSMVTAGTYDTLKYVPSQKIGQMVAKDPMANVKTVLSGIAATIDNYITTVESGGNGNLRDWKDIDTRFCDELRRGDAYISNVIAGIDSEMRGAMDDSRRAKLVTDSAVVRLLHELITNYVLNLSRATWQNAFSRQNLGNVRIAVSQNLKAICDIHSAWAHNYTVVNKHEWTTNEASNINGIRSTIGVDAGMPAIQHQTEIDSISAQIGVLSTALKVAGVVASIDFAKFVEARIKSPNVVVGDFITNMFGIALNLLKSVAPKINNAASAEHIKSISDCIHALRSSRSSVNESIRRAIKAIKDESANIFGVNEHGLASRLNSVFLRVWLNKLGVKRYDVNSDDNANSFFHSSVPQLTPHAGTHKAFVSSCYVKNATQSLVVQNPDKIRHDFVGFVKSTYTPNTKNKNGRIAIDVASYNSLLEYKTKGKHISPDHVFAFAKFWNRPIISVQDVRDGWIKFNVGLPHFNDAGCCCTRASDGRAFDVLHESNICALIPILQRLPMNAQMRIPEINSLAIALRSLGGDALMHVATKKIDNGLWAHLEDFRKRTHIDVGYCLKIVCDQLSGSGTCRDIFFQCVVALMRDPNTVVVYAPTATDVAGNWPVPFNHFHALLHEDITPDEIKKDRPL